MLRTGSKLSFVQLVLRLTIISIMLIPVVLLARKNEYIPNSVREANIRTQVE
jgi:hypothetical protein